MSVGNLFRTSFCAVLFINIAASYAQVKIGPTTSSPNLGAMLDVESSNRGFLPPRISLGTNTAQLNGIQPADGMVVYNLNTDVAGTLSGVGLYIWYGGKWNQLADKNFLSTNYTSKSASSTGAAPVATGPNAFAIGRGTTASSLNSFAYGGETTASNYEALAGGLTSTASGRRSVALGLNASSSGDQSMTFGSNVTSNSDNAMAFGTWVSTNAKTGTVIFGDASVSTATNAEVNNQYMARFAGGYKLYTNAALSTGAALGAGANSWSTVSDKRKKENFEPANGELFLQKIDTMKLSSWNYKGQNVKTFRHYGPMAQDLYGAFGKDSYGTIGNDTTIASADFDGINMIAIQGLIKRTNDLKVEKDNLQSKVSDLSAQNERLNKELQQEKATNATALAGILNELRAQAAKIKNLEEKSDTRTASIPASEKPKGR